MNKGITLSTVTLMLVSSLGASIGAAAPAQIDAAPASGMQTPLAERAAQTGNPLLDITKLAAGFAHTCALTTGGGVECWGYNGNGQLGDGTTTSRWTPVDVIGLASGVTALAAGGEHTCALTMGGGIKCWGANWRGQLGDGTITDRWMPVDVIGLTSGVSALTAGSGHTCALTTGDGAKCWGWNDAGQLGDGTTIDHWTPMDVSGLASGVSALAADGLHTCALTTGGGVKCWGWNGFGQLGDGTTTSRWVPVDVIGLASGVDALEAGRGHTCALTTGSGVKCWGWNGYGQLGDGTMTDRLTPVDVSGLASGVAAVAASVGYTCALTTGSGVKCWGANYFGQLGDGTTNDHLLPIEVSGLTSGVSALAAGHEHACAVILSGGVKCWGNNSDGQLGDGTATFRAIPMEVRELASGVTALAAGNAYSCALTTGGGVKCWGWNGFGQLGDGTTTDRSTPVDVVGLASGISALAASGEHTCALTTSGGAKCWGRNRYGELGDWTNNDRWMPVDVVGLASGVSALTAGSGHTCARTTSGGTKCWGDNLVGQLGDGTTTQRLTPVDVIGLESGVSALAAGGAHTCALTTSGGVKCWGWNDYGQLGDGTDTDRWTPVDVNGLASGVSALAAGGHHTCALTTGGGVKCWGANGYGQLGDGTTNSRGMPVDVIGLASGVTALAAGGEYTCALTMGGGVKCWGENTRGQLGDGTLTDYRLTPVEVSGLASNVAALAADWYHTCALINNGRMKCWGLDAYGQLGIGTLHQQLTPVNVAFEPPLMLNYAAGQPGSFFTLTGQYFPASSQATVDINGSVLTTTLPVNETGGFILFLDTFGADPGWYLVTVGANPGATIGFWLDPQAPLRTQEGGGMLLAVPGGIGLEANLVYLPLVLR